MAMKINVTGVEISFVANTVKIVKCGFQTATVQDVSEIA